MAMTEMGWAMGLIQNQNSNILALVVYLSLVDFACRIDMRHLSSSIKEISTFL